jgi:hypothetical protein
LIALKNISAMTDGIKTSIPCIFLKQLKISFFYQYPSMALMISFSAAHFDLIEDWLGGTGNWLPVAEG